MFVYQPCPDKGYEWINAAEPDDYERFYGLVGEPVLSSWTPIKVCRVRADRTKSAKSADFPWLGGHALVVRESVISAMGPMLLADGELLPLSSDDRISLHVYNSRIVDALDYAASEYTSFPGSDRIMHLGKPVFIGGRVRGINIFRLPHRGSPTYVSEKFVQAVQAAGLKGLDLKTSWSAPE